MGKLATFGILCLLAVVVAACTRTDGRFIRASATVLAGNWLLFAMPWIYAPAAPAFAFQSSNLDAWAMADLLSLIMIGWAGRRTWWSPILWSPYLVTLTMFAVAWSSGLPYEQYMHVLDAALAFQLLIIFTVGGGDCADYLSDLWRHRRIRHLGWAPVLRAAAS